MSVCVSEKALHEAWRRCDERRAAVATFDGRRLKVLYAGMPGGSYGPDFRDAVLEAEDGAEVVGDVEIHRHAAEWYVHGHDSDPNYGRVAFHAIGAPESTRIKAVNSMGMRVPELDMGKLVGVAEEDSLAVDRSDASRAEDARGSADWCDAAGDERFALKIRGRRADIERFGADLTMQMAVFECLGYPRNPVAFRHLARRLPWAFIVRPAIGQRQEKETGDGVALAMLRWAAGFGERPAWSPVPRLAREAPQWASVAGRPANRPEARLKAAAMLVEVWLRAGGPMRHALDAMRRAERSSGVREAYRFRGGVLGTGRAGEIVVNGVLPTIAAWAEIGRDAALYADAMRLYRAHPSLPSNSVLEEAKRVLERRGVSVGRVRGARRQQGLMHIYKSMLRRPRASRQMGFGCRALSS